MLSELVNVVDSCACPTVAATPEVVKAAFTKEGDSFGQHDMRYYDPALSFAEPGLVERQMYQFASEVFDVTESENAFAMKQGYSALERFKNSMRDQSTAILRQLEEEP